MSDVCQTNPRAPDSSPLSYNFLKDGSDQVVHFKEPLLASIDVNKDGRIEITEVSNITTCHTKQSNVITLATIPNPNPSHLEHAM